MRIRWGVLILALVMSLSTFTGALEIESPEKVPAYTPFTFRATLPSTEDFTSATVLFDNILVATIYPTGTCSIQPDWIPFLIHCATFDADPKTNEGLTTLITHTGFAQGPHTISMQTQGSKSENQLVNLMVIEVIDASVKDELTTQITTVQGRMDVLETTATSTQQQAFEIQSQLEQTAAETQSEISSLNQRVVYLEEPPLPVQTEDGFSISGLVGGISLPIIGIGILIVAAALVFFVGMGRKKEGGFGGGGNASQPFFEGSMDSLFKGLPSSKPEVAEAQPRKWSSDVENELRNDIERNPPESGKIQFGDLIQKERD